MGAILVAGLTLNRHRQHKLERVMGIEPTSSAWKAEVLPLNYTRLVEPLLFYISSLLYKE